jgi:glucose uptake protein GlcU
MKKEIPPWAFFVGIGALLLIVVGLYMSTNRQPPQVDATSVYSKATLADPDPPHKKHGRD